MSSTDGAATPESTEPDAVPDPRAGHPHPFDVPEADLLEQEVLVDDEEADLFDPEDRREEPEAAERYQDQVD